VLLELRRRVELAARERRRRGREREHPDRGRDLLMRLAEDVKEIGLIETQPLLEGRNMTMVLGPTKNAGVKRDAETEDTLGSEEEIQGERARGS